MIPRLWAELGNAPDRWASWNHLQAQAGTVPLTRQSGKSCVVRFRVACNKHLRQAIWQLAFQSLRHSEWAKHYYQRCRARGHQHNQALRALGAKWLKIIFRMTAKAIRRGLSFGEYDQAIPKSDCVIMTIDNLIESLP